MTDDELMGAPELKVIKRHLSAATATVRKLERRSGRKLSIFIEAEAGPMLMDDTDTSREDFSRLDTLDQGGTIVRKFDDPANWSCGAY